jgi:hypothetical protein
VYGISGSSDDGVDSWARTALGGHVGRWPDEDGDRAWEDGIYHSNFHWLALADRNCLSSIGFVRSQRKYEADGRTQVSCSGFGIQDLRV